MSKPAAQSEPLIPPDHSRCIMVVGPDRRIDQKGNYNTPVNVLPIKCQTCHFVDIDFVPERYALCKGIDTPVELAPAEVGNFLVREPVRQILELVAPGQCSFH